MVWLPQALQGAFFTQSGRQADVASHLYLALTQYTLKVAGVMSLQNGGFAR